MYATQLSKVNAVINHADSWRPHTELDNGFCDDIQQLQQNDRYIACVEFDEEVLVIDKGEPFILWRLSITLNGNIRKHIRYVKLTDCVFEIITEIEFNHFK